MYHAMNILGFKTYHFAECVFAKGLPHIKVMNEAMTAQYNRLSGIKRYKEAEFEKWMSEYDVSPCIPTQIFVELRKWSHNYT